MATSIFQSSIQRVFNSPDPPSAESTTTSRVLGSISAAKFLLRRPLSLGPSSSSTWLAWETRQAFRGFRPDSPKLRGSPIRSSLKVAGDATRRYLCRRRIFVSRVEGMWGRFSTYAPGLCGLAPLPHLPPSKSGSNSSFFFFYRFCFFFLREID